MLGISMSIGLALRMGLVDGLMLNALRILRMVGLRVGLTFSIDVHLRRRWVPSLPGLPSSVELDLQIL